MKKYVKNIVACSLLLLFLAVGCAEFAKGFRESAGNGTENVNHTHYPSNNDSYWRMEWEKEKLRRLEREQALEGARIREHTRQMLKRMELERKLREQR